jgi:hypothetical protein
LFGVSIYGLNLLRENRSLLTKVNNTDSKSKLQQIPLGWPWHGITIATHYDLDVNDDLKYLKAKGVNFIVIYLKPRKLAEFENLSADEAFKMSLKKADEILNKCRELNLYSMIYFSEFPVDPSKGKVRLNTYFWDHNEEQEIALNYISKTIDHFKSRGEELQAYQFIGEPVTVIEGKIAVPDGWNVFFKKIHTIIKNKDKSRFVVYSPGPGGASVGYKGLEPILDDSKIIYSMHYYLPHPFSHHLIKGRVKNYSYPGFIDFVYWDKAKLKSTLNSVVYFQKKYKKLILIGEFSAVYSADGWEQYLRDQLDLYQEFNFGYTYFTFNGYREWAVSDKNQSPISKKKFGKFNLDSREKRLNLLSQYWKH